MSELPGQGRCGASECRERRLEMDEKRRRTHAREGWKVSTPSLGFCLVLKVQVPEGSLPLYCTVLVLYLLGGPRPPAWGGVTSPATPASTLSTLLLPRFAMACDNCARGPWNEGHGPPSSVLSIPQKDRSQASRNLGDPPPSVYCLGQPPLQRCPSSPLRAGCLHACTNHNRHSSGACPPRAQLRNGVPKWDLMRWYP